MDISAIIKSIFEAKKIGGMTIAALAISLLAYLFNEKTGTIDSEDKVGALFVFFIITFVFLVVITFLYSITTTKMRYEHQDRMADKENQKEIEKQKVNTPNQAIYNKSNVIKGDNNGNITNNFS